MKSINTAMLAALFLRATKDTNHDAFIGSPMADLIGYAYNNDPSKFAWNHSYGLFARVLKAWGRNLSPKSVREAHRCLMADMGITPTISGIKSDADFLAAYGQ